MSTTFLPRILIPALEAGLLALLALLFMTACDGSVEPATPGSVVVSIPPLRGLVEPLLPEGTEVHVLVPAGRSVHGFEPSPADIATLSRANVVIVVGLGLEGPLIDAVSRVGKETALISMADVLGVEIGGRHRDHQQHDDDRGHECGHTDAHLWLDPVLAARFVRALPGHMPDHLEQTAGVAAEPLAVEIDSIDAAYRERLEPFRGRAIVTHHASMTRVAERYNLRIAAVLRAVESIEPSPADIAGASRAIAGEGVGAIFVEPQFSGTTAERLAESAGVGLVVLDPLGDGDWFKMMRTNLDRLVEGLSAGSDDP